MTVVITLTIAGTDSGPFDLYSDLDGYTSAFESGVSKAALLAGYPSALVPDYTNTIRVKSTGQCVNYVDIPLSSVTTTTTTTIFSGCQFVEVYPPIFNPGTYHTVGYLDCYSNPQTVNVPNGGTMQTICMTGITSDNGNGITLPLFTVCIP